MLLKNNKEQWNLIKNYRWKSIFFKYLSLILLAVALPICILVTIIFIYSDAKEKTEVSLLLKNSFEKTISTIEQCIEDVDKNAVALSSDKNIISLLTLPDSPENRKLAYEYYDIFLQKSQAIRVTREYISSLSLFSLVNNSICYDTGASDKLDDFSVLKEYSLSSYEEPCFFYNSDLKKLIRSYPVYNPNSSECIGIIYTYINILSLNDTILDDRAKNESVYILNNDNSFIFTGNTQNIVKTNDSDIILRIAASTVSDYCIEKHGDYYYCSTTLPVYKYILISKIPSSYTLNERSSPLTIFIIILVVCLLSVLLAFFVSTKIYGTIVEIISGIEIPTLQSLSDQEKQFNELLYINNNIVSIMSKNSSIEKELEQRINQLRRAQSIALQTQINPHFIFNTLNLVNVFILKITKQDTDATRIISLLSDILHGTLNTNNFIVPLKEEINYAVKYIDIEKIKSMNGFDAEFNFAPETLNCRMIKLSLQPIIENAVEHGFKTLSADRRGLLTLCSEIKNKTLVITISDNGEGMPLDTLHELSAKLSSDTLPETRHIGLCNVNQRIRLIFGSDYGLSIQSSPLGTTVIITMPATEM